MSVCEGKGRGSVPTLLNAHAREEMNMPISYAQREIKVETMRQ